MIHSRRKDPEEIFSFCEQYNKFERRVPLVVVPTTFDGVRDSELREHGVNIVIYANQLLRSAYPAMVEAARSILLNGRSAEIEAKLLPIGEILELIATDP
jgi:phosphoenolpyruvate phosphomutase